MNNVLKVCLKIPTIQELHYRQEWMKKPKTMSYNAGYDMDLKGYDKTTGTITKTDEEMITWYNNWINKEPDKYFAYIYNNDIEEPIGEVYYYLFSLSGFTDAVIETAKTEKNLFLVDVKQIVNGVMGE